MRRAAWALVLLLVAPLGAAAPGDGVDWGRQVLQVTGNGPPDGKASNAAQARLGAERSAKQNALERLRERVKTLPLRADRTVGEELGREELRRAVDTVLLGHTVVRKRYFSDGGVQVDVEVPLGALTSVLVAPEPAAPPAGTKPDAASKHTGLVVDARKLTLTPVLAPRLLDAKGQRVYSAASLSSEAWKSTGVAGFFPSLERAREAGGVGERPLVLEAVGIQGSDLQLGPDAEAALADLDPRLLAGGRVAILVR